jgi:antitoxin component YwqK of YwqJK toxin-antitoxin module
MKLSFTFLLVGFVLGCAGNEATENASSLPVNKEEALVDSLNGQYKEWYAGRHQLKYIGGQDADGRRHGRWTHYLESGVEKSMTTYTHGLREGFSIVKYDNGMIFYRGEWHKDEKVGLWTTYSPTGDMVSEINYSNP